MTFAQATEQAPLCPGCHFGCSLDNYQCARGERFFRMWNNGEEIPQRGPRGPHGPGARQGGPKGGVRPHGNMPLPGRLAQMLSIAPVKLALAQGKRPSPPAPHADPRIAVIVAAARHDGAAAAHIVAQRCGLSVDEVVSLAENAAQEDLVAFDEYEDGTVFLHVTDAGKERLAQVESEEALVNEQVFSSLDPDEQEQLVYLLDKVLASCQEML